MIKIIVPGAKPDKMKRFECPDCGCVFDVDESDYYETESVIKRYYVAACPICGRSVRKEELNG